MCKMIRPVTWLGSIYIQQIWTALDIFRALHYSVQKPFSSYKTTVDTKTVYTAKRILWCHAGLKQMTTIPIPHRALLLQSLKSSQYVHIIWHGLHVLAEYCYAQTQPVNTFTETNSHNKIKFIKSDYKIVFLLVLINYRFLLITDF
jgi:hypothetical protein